ncbi:unnamed protein product [Parnassius apollo]|uniref:(apollo) hypothetical protein n=1 Tax=Parnassius apollo TaxID=110799 RepID=A0A8S3X2V7_PARAO|nr:unnamed protein product [Parnassius apollo]
MTRGRRLSRYSQGMASQLIALILWLCGNVFGLREIHITVPEAVGVGSNAILGCRWALDTGEALYTVKWYHGAQEFFRFVPKELPNTRVFSQTGINVDVSRSGAQQVVLREATRGLSGRYRCEVSADAPFFHTVYKSAFMRVIDLPLSEPKVRAQKGWYSVGDMLRANCTSPPADPPANLTWLINGYEVKGLNIPVIDSYYERRKPTISDASLEDANRIIFSPQLVIRVQHSHFQKGRLNVTCVARVLSVWSASGILLLDEEKPQIAPVMGSRDSSSGGRRLTTVTNVGVFSLCNFVLLRQWSIR